MEMLTQPSATPSARAASQRFLDGAKREYRSICDYGCGPDDRSAARPVAGHANAELRLANAFELSDRYFACLSPEKHLCGLVIGARNACQTFSRVSPVARARSSGLHEADGRAAWCAAASSRATRSSGSGSGRNSSARRGASLWHVDGGALVRRKSSGRRKAAVLVRQHRSIPTMRNLPPVARGRVYLARPVF